MKKNSRGFTLVELIAVLAIMIIILLIAIPSITSSVDRNKNNLSEQAINIITTSAEVYSSMYMVALNAKQAYDKGCCYIEVSSLIEKELLKESELKELTTISNINEYRIFNLKEFGIRIFAPDGTFADGTTPKKFKMPNHGECTINSTAYCNAGN